jgi:hypothetical protein
VPPTEAVVVDPRDRVTDLGMLSDSERMALEAEIDTEAQTTTTTTTQPPQGPLAGTGVNVTPMVFSACALILIGALLLLLGSRRTRTPRHARK